MDIITDEMLANLETAIGYVFVDRRFLDEALTHRSFVNECGNKALNDNQRLEFFGDAVIDFVLSRMLLDIFPHSREGALSKIRATLVDEESLAGIAVTIGLGECLKLGRGEEKSGGRMKRSLLADAYEALIAAVFLDGGLDPVQRLLSDHFEPFLKKPSGIFAGKDFKTDLQELAQATHNTIPRYHLKEISGPEHDRLFSVTVYVETELLGEGSGRSKKEAEQAAARAGIAKLKSNSAVVLA
jgi:ribonuclease-3